MSIVLGIDPGSRLMGYGVVTFNNQTLKHLDHGTLQIKGTSITEKCYSIFEQLSIIIKQHQPDSVAIEEVFFAKNARTALVLGQARGAALTAIAHHQLKPEEYSARAIKQSITGSGKASKQQVQQMVKMLLKLVATPANDAADGLACAVCHCHHQGVLAKINRATITAGKQI
jgi:crossover junction endodeoxyribonuclease RuvC